MYKRFFGLHHQPFSIAPDPRYLYMSERHREALAHLLYGLNGGGGFVLLTGEIGTGKTTVCRLFLEQIPANCNVAYIFNPKQTVIELLRSICDEFGIAVPDPAVRAENPGKPAQGGKPDHLSEKHFIDLLNAFLLDAHAKDRNNILIIDEAQNLSADVLEQLRLLTNLETSERKLLQIILIGQPELRAMLAKPELEQLAQRIIARFHLAALSQAETAHYVAHRLAVSGSQGASPFNPRSVRCVHALTGGIPRRINLLCDRALLGAYAAGEADVHARTVKRAAREVFDYRAPAAGGKQKAAVFFIAGSGAATLAAIALAVGFGHSGTNDIRRFFPDAGAPARLSAAVNVTPKPTAAPTVTRARAPAGEVLATSVDTGTPSAATAQPAIVSTDNPTATAKAMPVALGREVRDLSAAYRRLGALWGLQIGAGDFCALARQQNTYCYDSKNGLGDIRQLGRPVILTLRDDDDQKYYALLVGLNDRTATLRIGDVTETVTLSALARRWRGGFTTLWRGPAGYDREIVKGDRGPVVAWVAARLAGAAPGTSSLGEMVFDDRLDRRIREFQLSQGLAPDGLPGPQTLVRLASVAGNVDATLTHDAARAASSPNTSYPGK